MNSDCTEIEPRPRVLCVDDDHHFTIVLGRRLNAHGIDVSRASSGLQGYCKALQERPDLVITDFEMPEGRGDFLIERMREHSTTRNIPVIVVTGCDLRLQQSEDSSCSLGEHLMNLGAGRILSKPLNHIELMDELAKHIRLHPLNAHNGMSADEGNSQCELPIAATVESLYS